jgi:hypothetical protein
MVNGQALQKSLIFVAVVIIMVAVCNVNPILAQWRRVTQT